MPDALLVTSSFLPGRGGIESYLAALCDELAPRLAVLAPAHREGRPLPSDLSYPTTGLDVPVRAGRTVADRIESVARMHGTKRVLFGTPWPLGLLGPAIASRGLRYAAIVHGAETFVPAAVPVLRRRIARALAGADALFSVSRYTAERTRRAIESCGRQSPPVERLPVRIDLGRFHPDVPTEALRERLGLIGRDVVVYMGRLVRRKGAHRLIEALPDIASRVPSVALVIGGTGPEQDRLRRLARDSGHPIALPGRIADADAPALYALADVFALPVTDRWRGLEVEGLGVVLLEASACATPCVTGRSGGTPEAVIEATTGFVIDAHDRDSLIDRVVRLLQDKREARAMGNAAREHVRTGFTQAPLPETLLEWLEHPT